MTVTSWLLCCLHHRTPPSRSLTSVKSPVALETIVFRKCGQKITVIKHQDGCRSQTSSNRHTDVCRSLRLRINKLKQSVSRVKPRPHAVEKTINKILSSSNPRSENYVVSRHDTSPKVCQDAANTSSPTVIIARAIDSDIIPSYIDSPQNRNPAVQSRESVRSRGSPRSRDAARSHGSPRSRVKISGRRTRLAQHRKRRLRRTDIVNREEMKLILEDDNITVTDYDPEDCNNNEQTNAPSVISQITDPSLLLNPHSTTKVAYHLIHSPNGLTDPLKKILLAAETPALGTSLTQNLISEHEMERLKILKQNKSGEPLHTRPLVRQGGFKRKLMRAVSNTDPSKNIDIVLETESYPRQFSNPTEKRASIRKAKVDNIRRAAVCSLYLQEREKKFSDGSISPGNLITDQSPSPPAGRPSVFSPNIPLITQPTTNLKRRPQRSWRLSDLNEDHQDDIQEDSDSIDSNVPNALCRSKSFAPHRKTRTREAARTNSCLARYICLPAEMSVRDEIKWARRSIKLYREFSQLSSNNRTDSYLNLDLFFSDDFDKSDDIFQAVEEEEKDGDEDDSDDMDVDEVENTAFDIFYNLSSLYRTTCPYKRFGDKKLMFPFGVCCNPDGSVYVSDWEAGLIYQLENIEDELQATVEFPTALGVCTVGQDLYITSEQDQHLYLTTNNGEKVEVDLGEFSSPDGICYLQDRIYVVEEINNRITVLTPQGHHLLSFGDDSGTMSLNKPGGIAVYSEKELLVVCDRGNKRIALWTTDGIPKDVIPLTQHPDCCSYAGAGILVVGTSEGEVMFVDLDCKQHVFSWTNKQLKYPGFITGVAVDNRQNVYICDPKNHRVIKVHK